VRLSFPSVFSSARIASWFYGDTPPERGEIVLGHRRVYIVPSRLGLFFAGTLAILLVGSINYVLSLGFALTFLLAGMGIAAMVQTTRNLARLSIRAGRCEPVFSGEEARFMLSIANTSQFDRPEILARHLGSGTQRTVDVAASDAAVAILPVPTRHRGWLALGRVMLETRFPVGLFRAWSYVEPDCRCLVYPQPLASPLPPAAPNAQTGGAHALAKGNDDFSGLRAYQPADSPRHVAWKSAARSDDMLTKQFAGAAAAQLWLDLRDLAPSLGLEQRLSRLTGWVLAAERAGALYGLRLPGSQIEPGQGEAHRAACLEALALYKPA
jgi:uncharacterized protein (DUF58 family)